MPQCVVHLEVEINDRHVMGSFFWIPDYSVCTASKASTLLRVVLGAIDRPSRLRLLVISFLLPFIHEAQCPELVHYTKQLALCIVYYV
jgi:hypothetical protein